MKLKIVPMYYALLLCLIPGRSGALSFQYASDLGVVIDKSGETCLTIDNPGLRVGSRLHLVVMTTPESIVEAEVVHMVPDHCHSTQSGDDGSRHYQLRVVSGSLPSNTPAIAVANSVRPLALKGSYVTGDLDGDGRHEFFRACTSTEGVHLTVWSRKPLRGKLRWHRYYYLGYDVQTTCTAQESLAP